MSELAGLVVPLVVLPYVTRALGVHSYGRLQTVLAAGGFAALLGNPGLGVLAMRRAARRPGRVAATAGRVQPLRVGFGAAAAAVFAALPPVLGWSRELATMTWLQAGTVLVQAFAVDSYLLGLGDGAWVGFSRSATLVLYGVGVLALVRTPDDGPVVLAVALATQALVVGAGLARLRRLGGPSPWRVSRKTTGLLLREGLGFFGSSLMSLVYARIDVLFLRLLRGEREVGIYGACVRLTEGLYGVSNVLVGTLFPRAVAEARTRPRRASVLAQRALRLAALVFVPAAVGAAVAGGPLVAWVAGPEFAGADATMALLGLTFLPAACASIVTSFGLTSRGRSGDLLAATAAGAGANVVGNVAAIPLLGAPGAAATTALAQGVVAAVAARRAGGALRVDVSAAIAPWLPAALAMGAAVGIARALGAPAWALLAIGLAVYPAVALAGRRLRRSEARGLRRLVGLAPRA
jgi:O-antigen/teichoic acid export membrane protein